MYGARTMNLIIVSKTLNLNQLLSEGLNNEQYKHKIVGSFSDANEIFARLSFLKADIIVIDEDSQTKEISNLESEIKEAYHIPIVYITSEKINSLNGIAKYSKTLKKPDFSNRFETRVFIKSLIVKFQIAQSENNRGMVMDLSNNFFKENPEIKKINKLPPINDKKINEYIIAIGASTGGTEVILEILKQMPKNAPGIVITQHMPKGFTDLFAKRLNSLCEIEVREAKNGDFVKPGLALVAPGEETQMAITGSPAGYVISCFKSEKVSGHRPSVDVLFNSVAKVAKENAIGVILTGMGQDGAYGLLSMKNAGAYTIGQDKESCVVYGMPMIAQQIGAVAIQLDCKQIGGHIINYLKR